ncbi:MAG: TonB-dependent receptor [Gemmatimonadetes bacterium]|nr:TonB-dependent receptor [Gemmatimonadota bacterium]
MFMFERWGVQATRPASADPVAPGGASTHKLAPSARRVLALIAITALIGIGATDAAGQQGGSVSGTVASEGGEPVFGATVTLAPGGRVAITDVRGEFRFANVPEGTVTLGVVRLGYSSAEQAVSVRGGAQTRLELVVREVAIELAGLVVSASREAQRLAETPASVSALRGSEIRAVGASHPSEIMRQVPGAWISVTGGEGHQTAIRQPLTTNPVYLYLEDGIPTRSTGFFNHNALYEINLPQADRIEVTKGPASALYGSDAVGGIINVGTRAPSAQPGLDATLEGGSFGWQRLLLSGSSAFGPNGLRADLNLTRTDGWRDATDYDRQSATIRWDRPLGNGTIRTVATFSNIDQNTAGSSAISANDYRDNPKVNYTPISFRTVKALRLSTEYAHLTARTLFTVTPFARWNEMGLLANWSLTYDPTVYTTGHRSLGLLAKVRHDFQPLSARLIAGVDVDYSPGFREETQLQATRVGSIFTTYTEVAPVYDYDVTFHAVSPYLQVEASPVPGLRVVGGLRYDRMGFSYDTHLDPIATGRHRRPEDTSVVYGHLSPKLGATLEVAEALGFFANYAHGFRAPSEGQLFRQGQAVNTVGLDPVKVDSYEGGARGLVGGRVSYSATAYHMTKYDDILRFTNPDGTTENVNAGETLHRGVEVGLGADLVGGLRADVAFSRARHTYEEWVPRAGTDLGGSEVETAPRTLVNVLVSYAPASVEGLRLGAEWTKVGSYWMDPQNTHRYPGHDTFHLRLNVPLLARVSAFGRLVNVTDERFAESSSFTTARGEEFAPGMPRTLYLGLRWN